ncbi:MAG: hypothetical protein ACRD96_17830 [Bryobacteraceae bacterium]
MKRDPDFFAVEPRLVYIAKRLDEALAVEDLLTKNGIDYLVEPDRYRGGFLFPSERVGAFFYVAEDSVEPACCLLRQNGYRPQPRLEPD